MFQMIHFEIYLVLIAVSYNILSEAYAISVWNCPCSKEKWEERSRDFNCEEKTYTCILNKDGKLIETCIIPYTFNRDEVGCPFVQQVMPDVGALIGIENTWCNVTGCPLLGHVRYRIDEMYKYPVCYVPEEKRKSMNMDDLTDTNTVCAPESEFTTNSPPKVHNNKEDSPPIFLIVGLVVLILVAALVAVLFAAFRKRRHCLMGCPEARTTSQEYTNFAIGLAWSHYTGYLKTLLPALNKAIKDSETYKAHPERTKFTWVMLCPRSATSTDLTQAHSIKLAETIPVPQTYFKVNMYEIKTRGSEETWYCCMEYPSALMSLGNQSEILSPEKVALEAERFSYYIMNILNHEENKQCKEKAVTLFYDESETTVTNEVALKILDDENKKEDNNVSICLLKTRQNDRLLEKTYHELEKSLSTSKRETFTANLLNDDQRIIVKALNKADWIILYGVNRKILFLNSWLLAVLEQLVNDGKCKVLCLFAGTHEERATRFIPLTVAIDLEKDDNIVAQVKSIVLGLPPVTSSDIVLGDVSFGVSWSFYVNYLQHVLPDLHQRLAAAVESEMKKMNLGKSDVRVSKRLWEIVPTSCTFEELSKFDDKILGPIKVVPLQKSIYETKRVYQVNMYYFKVGQTTHFFLAEVFSPCKVMKAMKESSLVKLSEKQFIHLRSRMIDQTKSVLATFQNKYSDGVQTEIVQFKEGGSQSLSDMIYSHISKETTSTDDENKDSELTDLIGVTHYVNEEN